MYLVIIFSFTLSATSISNGYIDCLQIASFPGSSSGKFLALFPGFPDPEDLNANIYYIPGEPAQLQCLHSGAGEPGNEAI